jgi:hypothetical protein
MPGMAAKEAAPAAAGSLPEAAAPVDEKTAPASPAAQLSGKVLQTMDSGGYTYIYMQKDDMEKVWVAVTVAPIMVGSKVSFKGGMEMLNFDSKGLKRKFDKIIFADSVVSDSPSVASIEKEKGVSGGSKVAVSAKDTKISVPKASGANAYTVQEIFDKSAKLNKKKVVVSGKVVKVSSGIMGKNWIHIQDGTGTQAKKNHNLVCTSSDMADVDDIVTVSGVLAKDKDFGGGYKYNAIVEDATIKK